MMVGFLMSVGIRAPPEWGALQYFSPVINHP
jgi:hypothetical protein